VRTPSFPDLTRADVVPLHRIYCVEPRHALLLVPSGRLQSISDTLASNAKAQLRRFGTG